MTDALFIFTFSPVQSFIVEARRAADLYTGSQILVELGKAASEAIGKENLIYPALDENDELPDDIPNKLVARVRYAECEAIAGNARDALLKRWKNLAEESRNEFLKHAPGFETSAWDRQMLDATLPKTNEGGYLWETYWSAASLIGRSYEEAYKEVELGLAAVKFTRPFGQNLEPGFKDTLSGKRQALYADGNGQEYWFKVGLVESITPIKIRPSTATRPRERLDAIGVIKRFHPELSEKAVSPFHGFPSTSSMASATFLKHAKDHCLTELESHRDAISTLLKPDKKFKIRDDAAWPFDGELLYPETLRSKRMKSDYGKDFSESDLKLAREALSNLYIALQTKQKASSDKFITTSPSPYYAIIVLDGDSMGEHLRTLDETGHRAFSVSLRQFAQNVNRLADEHLAKVIYNGGDDVLAMAPLKSAFTFASRLAVLFNEKTKRSASAGIAIAHHLSPLSHTLQSARHAEHHAKQMKDKNAVCVIALKRSGEPIQVRSNWDAVNGRFEEIISLFENDEISSKLPFDVDQSAYGLPQADEKLEAELKRLIRRHVRTKDFRDNQAVPLATNLRQWAQSFTPDGANNQPANQLADWLSLAHFIAKGGRE